MRPHVLHPAKDSCSSRGGSSEGCRCDRLRRTAQLWAIAWLGWGLSLPLCKRGGQDLALLTRASPVRQKAKASCLTLVIFHLRRRSSGWEEAASAGEPPPPFPAPGSP